MDKHNIYLFNIYIKIIIYYNFMFIIDKNKNIYKKFIFDIIKGQFEKIHLMLY